MSKFEVVPNVPGQWYVRRAGDFTNPPVALFYDLGLAEQFVASAAPAEGREDLDLLLNEFADAQRELIIKGYRQRLIERSNELRAKLVALTTAPTVSEADRQLRLHVRRLLDFINNEGPAAKEWQAISETSERIGVLLAEIDRAAAKGDGRG